MSSDSHRMTFYENEGNSENSYDENLESKK